MSFGLSAVAVGAIGGVISGGIGIWQGSKQQKLAKKAFKKSDPFGPYRAEYAEKLGNLMKDPTDFLKNPLFTSALELGTQAVSRAFASQGFLGSGNMAAGLQQYAMGFGWDALQDQAKLLSQLAGATIAPDFSAALGGYAKGTDTIGGGLKSLFGGLTKLAGM